MKISDLLEEKFLILDFKNDTKEKIINELIDLCKDDERVINLEEIRKCVLEREKVMSTGVGKGFAIPHGKTNYITEIIAAFGRSTTPIEYESLDGEPVHLVFLLVGKEKLIADHIKLLSRISRLMNNEGFREKLIDAKSKEEVLNIFKEEEKNYSEV